MSETTQMEHAAGVTSYEVNMPSIKNPLGDTNSIEEPGDPSVARALHEQV